MPRRSITGFTLVELLIVVIILSILAGVVIPQFNTSTSEATESALMTSLHTLRNAIEVYKVQHSDKYPGSTADTEAEFKTHLTTKTKKDGTAGGTLGPYLRTGVPKNPVNNLSTVKISATFTADDTTGWIYDPDTGTIKANSTGAGPSGANYIDI